MARIHLTDKAIRSLQADGQAAYQDYWDSSFPGGRFGVRVSKATRAKTFQLYYRANGRRRRETIGRYPDLSLADARARARETLARVQMGSDPSEEKRQ